MTVTHTWKANKLDYDAETMRVSHVHYTLETTDGTHRAMSYGSVKLEGEASIPYEIITEELAISWCHRELGEDKVASRERRNQQELSRLGDKASGVPWS